MAFIFHIVAFGRLKISEDQPVLRSECIIWSYVHNAWCRAKVFELFDDSVKVSSAAYSVC